MPAQSPAKTPHELLKEEINNLQNEVESAQGKVRLASLRDEIEDLETHCLVLPQRTRDLRASGYVFEKELEARAEGLVAQWRAIKPQVQAQIAQQSNHLSLEVKSAELMIQQLSGRVQSPAAAQPQLMQLKSALSTLDNEVSAAEALVKGMYDSYQADLEELRSHLASIEWTMAEAAEACFKLSPTEGMVMAVKATWLKDGKEDKADPKGILFLTDQRILFEQKQEIATRKFLFITTEKQKVQQLLLETPAVSIDTVKASKQGLFKNEDHLEISCKSGSPYQNLYFHLDGQDSRVWQALLGKVASGHFDQDRAVALDQAAVDRVKKAPSQCPACGANVSQPVLRGMDSLNCEYCGFVMRLD